MKLCLKHQLKGNSDECSSSQGFYRNHEASHELLRSHQQYLQVHLVKFHNAAHQTSCGWKIWWQQTECVPETVGSAFASTSYRQPDRLLVFVNYWQSGQDYVMQHDSNKTVTQRCARTRRWCKVKVTVVQKLQSVGWKLKICEEAEQPLMDSGFRPVWTQCGALNALTTILDSSMLTHANSKNPP